VEPRRFGARHTRLEPVESRKSVVPVELPGGTVIHIDAALGRKVDLPSRSATHFGGIGAGLYLEFVDRVNRWREAEAVAVQIHGFDAIVVKSVLRIAGAVGGHAHGLSD